MRRKRARRSTVSLAATRFGDSVSAETAAVMASSSFEPRMLDLGDAPRKSRLLVTQVSRRLDRRAFLGLVGAGTGGLVLGACARATPGGSPAMDAAPAGFPEKAADLIVHTDRPPNLEMPLRYFRQDLTPNDAMFVRWHLRNLPQTIDLRTW